MITVNMQCRLIVYTVNMKNTKRNTDMIPPTFTEIWKLMFQRVFNHFKHDTDDGTQPPVTNDQRLQLQSTTNFVMNYLRSDKTIRN